MRKVEAEFEEAADTTSAVAAPEVFAAAAAVVVAVRLELSLLELEFDLCSSEASSAASAAASEGGAGFGFERLLFRQPPPTGTLRRTPPLVQYLRQLLQKCLG